MSNRSISGNVFRISNISVLRVAMKGLYRTCTEGVLVESLLDQSQQPTLVGRHVSSTNPRFLSWAAAVRIASRVFFTYFVVIERSVKLEECFHFRRGSDRVQRLRNVSKATWPGSSRPLTQAQVLLGHRQFPFHRGTRAGKQELFLSHCEF